MADVRDRTGHDDAPLSTAKDGERAQIVASELDGAKGDTLSGKTVTINRPRDELFAVWRDFSNLPKFLDNVISVEQLSDGRSHWTVRGPGERTVEWTSVVTQETPGELIAWTTEEGADVPNSGRIEFRDAPGGRGTWVTATVLYDPPASVVGKIVAKMFQREPAIQARRDLRRFKQFMETGEVATAARTRKQLDEENA
ncbi:putative membrane protein [Novosphingobium sp. PhB165]|uniref:SRPBCC family protein n=1 Tax=Novosphingobium sp. PhB165 TaxID=2485105 RepID=UPI001043CAA8|nr:SRPBCC family protein [Novosphingobium sp. PhB165]TCM14020.1 putative membrane protein [Novosphingobium sp. PhB165]